MVLLQEHSPTYQQIIDIYVVTEGENYTIGDDIVDYVPDDTNGPIIVESGEGYDSDDRVIDSDGNEYTIETDDAGRIYNVIRGATEYKSVTNTVEYDVITSTGSGVRLKPRLIPRPIQPQGEVKRVIDCIE